jgi:uncharacterized protein involved in exopolysaccharide biosynthesis
MAASGEFSNDSDTPCSGIALAFDDAMMRTPRRRMTVAQLKERMDTRFKAVDRRFDAADARVSAIDRKLDSIGDKLNSIAKRLDDTLDGDYEILHEHEERLRDLEPGRRTT